MNELALFAGAGGGILGGELIGWRTVCAVEREPYAASVLVARQNDGLLPPFPIWDDVRTFDGRPWRGIVDVVSGGFPCQDISLAGKGAGITGKHSGLWSEFVRIIREVAPGIVFVENSPALTSRGLGAVLGDLASLGFDARWGVLGASAVGAPHIRMRIWIVANARCGRPGGAGNREVEQPWRAEAIGAGAATHANGKKRESGSQEHQQQWKAFITDGSSDASDPNGPRLEERQGQRGNARQELAASLGADWWESEPAVGRVANGVAARVDRLKAIGNGQVPQCAAEAWRRLMHAK